MSSAPSQRKLSSIVLAMIASVAQASIDWNLESTFLQHLQQKANETATDPKKQDDPQQPGHIYPTWVSEGTCSTKCVDIRGEEEFCVATSTCEHAMWRRAFDRHKMKEKSLNDFELPMSMSHCEVWGDMNRCDGTLCDDDHECQSGCCGSFVSFTHNRCLPLLGEYCAGRDTTRHRPRHSARENGIDLDEHMLMQELMGHGHDENEEEADSIHSRLAMAQHVQERLNETQAQDEIRDVVAELV